MARHAFTLTGVQAYGSNVVHCDGKTVEIGQNK